MATLKAKAEVRRRLQVLHKKAVIQRPQWHMEVSMSIDLYAAGLSAVCLLPPQKAKCSVVASLRESDVVEIAYKIRMAI